MYHGHRQIEIGNCRPLDDVRVPNALAGRFFVFSKINFDDPWLNLARNTEATDDDLSLLNIPAHLAPEFRQFRFIFDVRKHTLYVEKTATYQHSISPKAFVAAINRMFKTPKVAAMFDEINAFLVTDEDAIERILNLNKLRRLSILVHRPNPDDDEFEEEVLAGLEKQNVGTQETILVKAPGRLAIIPSSWTRRLAHLAARVGLVEGSGKDDQGAPVTVKTEDHPKEHNVVHLETEDSLDKMVDFVSEKNGREFREKQQKGTEGGDI